MGRGSKEELGNREKRIGEEANVSGTRGGKVDYSMISDNFIV
jgi:hypothetical protein